MLSSWIAKGRYGRRSLGNREENWTEELKIPDYNKRSVESWQARFRKKKPLIFNIVKKPMDGRIASGQKKKIVVGSRVSIKVDVKAVVKEFKNGKAILEFPGMA